MARKSCETLTKVVDPTPQVMMDRSKLIVLKDGFAVMQKRNSVLIAENKNLRDQLEITSNKIRELEDKNLARKPGEENETERMVEERGISTTDFLVTIDHGIEASAVCRWCERKLDHRKSAEATAIITKSELDRLEMDMQRLRDAVVTRERDFDRAIEREHCYREQLKRFADESTTSRQLSESRHSELERLARTLAAEQETERDLRLARKETSGLKKIIVKLEKRQSEETNSPHNLKRPINSDITEKELRWIDDIVRQLSNAKNKQRSKQLVNNREKAIYNSATNSTSNHSSPRSNGTSIDEPVTITEIFSKL